MSTTKTLKSVDEDSWFEFKSLAAKNNMKIGKFFEKMIEEYKENSKNFWEDILGCEKILSDEEAKYIEKVVKRVRKEIGFRSLQ